jgi:SagB-type dehydrogenase family enzyme
MLRPTILALCVVLPCCGGDHQPGGAGDAAAPMAPLGVTDLPPPALESDVSIEEALLARASVREFTTTSLDAAQLAQLLWAAQGQTRDWGGRTAPSAGRKYPLELYAVAPDGLWRYLPGSHQLEQLGDQDLRTALGETGQSFIGAAPLIVVIAAVYARTEEKYGERAERYVKLEAGHACQSLLLQAAALQLGAAPIGAFDDAEVQSVLGLPADHEPLYLVLVGNPL